jgi:hypothetical protein
MKTNIEKSEQNYEITLESLEDTVISRVTLSMTRDEVRSMQKKLRKVLRKGKKK